MRFFVTLLCTCLVASAFGQISVRGRPARSDKIKLAVEPLELEPQLEVEQLAVQPTLFIKNPRIVPAVLPIADTEDILPKESAGKRRIMPYAGYPRYWPDYDAPADNWYGWNSGPRYWNGPRTWMGYPGAAPYWPRRRLVKSPISDANAALNVDDAIVSDVVPVPIPISQTDVIPDETAIPDADADRVVSAQVVS